MVLYYCYPVKLTTSLNRNKSRLFEGKFKIPGAVKRKDAQKKALQTKSRQTSLLSGRDAILKTMVFVDAPNRCHSLCFYILRNRFTCLFFTIKYVTLLSRLNESIFAEEHDESSALSAANQDPSAI